MAELDAELQALRGADAAFIAAFRRARSFSALMQNGAFRVTFENLVTTFTGLTADQANAQARLIKQWFETKEEANDLRQMVNGVAMQLRADVDQFSMELKVLLLRVGILMYKRVFGERNFAGMINHIPLMIEPNAFKRDPIALQCCKYILTGDASGDIFRRASAPVVHPSDEIRTTVMANIDLNTVLNTLLTSFRASVRRGALDITQSLRLQLRDPVARFDIPHILNLVQEEKSIVSQTMIRLAKLRDIRARATTALDRYIERVSSIVAYKNKEELWKSQRDRLLLEKHNYTRRLDFIRRVFSTIDGYKTIFNGHMDQLSLLADTSVVATVVPATDAMVDIGSKAYRALEAFLNACDGRRPDVDRAENGLALFNEQMAVMEDGRVRMKDPQGQLQANDVVANMYNALVYWATVLLVGLAGNAECMAALTNESIHLQHRIDLLGAATSRSPERLVQVPQNNQHIEAVEEVDISEVDAAREQAIFLAAVDEANRLMEEDYAGPPVANAQEYNVAATAEDILAVSSLFPIETSGSIDHLVLFSLAETGIVDRQLVHERAQQLLSRVPDEEAPIALGSLNTAADFIKEFAKSPAPVVGNVDVQKVTNDVVSKITPVLKGLVQDNNKELRAALARSLNDARDAHRKYDKAVSLMHEKAPVFLDMPRADAGLSDRLDQATLLAIHQDFIDEAKKFERVLNRFFDEKEMGSRISDNEVILRCFASFHDPHVEPIRFGPNFDFNDHIVPWAAPLRDLENLPNPLFQLLAMSALRRGIRGLKARYESWRRGGSTISDQSIKALDDRCSQYINTRSLGNVDSLDRFIDALPVARNQQAGAPGKRAAELLQKKFELEAKVQAQQREIDDLKRDLEEEKKKAKAREEAHKLQLAGRDNDLDNRKALFDLDKRRVAMDAESKLAKIELHRMQERAKYENDLARRQNHGSDRAAPRNSVSGDDGSSRRGEGRGQGQGQAYILNTANNIGMSTAARVIDMAMGQGGVRLPMGFTHPFDGQVREGYRRGPNPLAWFEHLLKFVTETAPGSHLSAEACMRDAMPDVSLLQYVKFYEPDGYDAEGDEFTKDFRIQNGQQLYLPGRTFDNGMTNKASTDLLQGKVSSFIQARLREKGLHTGRFMADTHLRAARRKLAALKTQQKKAVPAAPAPRFGGFFREFTGNERNGLEREVRVQSSADEKELSPAAVDFSKDTVEFLPLPDDTNESLRRFVDAFNREPRNLGVSWSLDVSGVTTETFEFPLVAYFGSDPKRVEIFVRHRWERLAGAGDARRARAEHLKWAMRKVADDNESLGTLGQFSIGEKSVLSTTSQRFEASESLMTSFIGESSTAGQRSLLISLFTESSQGFINFVELSLRADERYRRAMDQADGMRHQALRGNPRNDDRGVLANIDDWIAGKGAGAQVDNVVEIGGRLLNNMGEDEIKQYIDDHMEVAELVHKLAAEEAKFIVQMQRLSRIHAANMENVLSEYLTGELILPSILDALQYARQCFGVNKKGSPLMLPEILVSSCAREPFRKLVNGYASFKHASSASQAATRQAIELAQRALRAAQDSIKKNLTYNPKLTPFDQTKLRANGKQDKFLRGEPFTDIFYYLYERTDWSTDDSFGGL